MRVTHYPTILSTSDALHRQAQVNILQRENHKMGKWLGARSRPQLGHRSPDLSFLASVVQVASYFSQTKARPLVLAGRKNEARACLEMALVQKGTLVWVVTYPKSHSHFDPARHKSSVRESFSFPELLVHSERRRTDIISK